jgi:hypothetical protein
MSLIIETPTEYGTEWGVSFTSHNPEPYDYVECATYKDAERLHVYLVGLTEQTAIRDSELESLKRERAMLIEALQWYVDNDEVNEWQAGNDFWIDGKRKAQKALSDINK